MAKTGSLMPLDVNAGFGGTVERTVRPDGSAVGRVVPKGERGDRADLYISHFATCSNAAGHRKRRQEGEDQAVKDETEPKSVAPKLLDEELELAFWKFDSLRKRKGMPISERDAFKVASAGLIHALDARGVILRRKARKA